MGTPKIQHLGIVALDIKDILVAFHLEDHDILEVYEDSVQDNPLYFIYLDGNNMWLECVIPKGPSSTVWTFAKKYGTSLHHLGFLTSDLSSERARHQDIPGMFEIGNYQLEVRSFGGEIETLFFAYSGLIIEFIKKLERRP